MPEKVFAHPEKIRSAANDVASYAEFLNDEIGALRRAIDSLSSRWKDQQFREFKDHFDGTTMVLKRFIEKTREIRPILIEDARRLAEFQSLNIKG